MCGGVAEEEKCRTLKTHDISYLPMVNGKAELTGIISFRDIRPVLTLKDLIIARDVATTKVFTVNASDSVQVALEVMDRRGISQLPVVSEDNDQWSVVSSPLYDDFH